jgi:hypothetical protein
VLREESEPISDEENNEESVTKKSKSRNVRYFEGKKRMDFQ